MSILDDFLRDINNESNYRLLLWLALEATKGSSHAVLELGPHPGATPYLHAYCEVEARQLVTVEESLLEVMKWSHLRTPRHEIACHAWSSAPLEQNTYSVAFLKHAPGDRRWADAMRLLNRCQIIVLHNTEPAADYGYHFSQIWGEFKYRADVKTGGAWATAISNSHDLHKWRGTQFGDYVVSAGYDDVKPDVVQDAVNTFLSTPIE